MKRYAVIGAILLGVLSTAHAQWIAVGNPSDSWIYGLFVNGNTLCAGTDMGVFMSGDSAVTWTRYPGQFGKAKIYRFARNDSAVFAGGYAGMMYRSTDNGISWDWMNHGVGDVDIEAFATMGGLVFATGYGGVYRSDDNGIRWSHIGLSNIFTHALTVIGNRIFVGADGGIYRSDDSGKSWREVKTGLAAGAEVYALVSGGSDLFAGTYRKGVFRSTNGGEHWNPIGSGLQGTNVTALLYRSTLLYAVTDSGLFYSRDSGNTWSDLNNGFPSPHSIPISSLTANDTFLYIGTRSGGVWRRSVSDFSMADVAPLPPQKNTTITISTVPNPTTAASVLLYSLPSPTSVTITITDALGRVVVVPAQDQVQESGEHRVVIGTSGLGSGVYLCRLQAGYSVAETRLIIIR